MTRTFSIEDQLPNLQVPELENTIEKYLYSVKASMTNLSFAFFVELASGGVFFKHLCLIFLL